MMNKKIISMLLIVLFSVLITTDVECLSLEETEAIMPQIQEDMGITEEVEVIPLSYTDMVASGQDIWHTYGWICCNADYRKIYVNQWLLDGLQCDYVWTIAHELTHIKQIEKGTLDREAYAEKQFNKFGYNEIPNEQEAESNAYYYCMKYNKR